jgi:hypothetical protein
MPDERVNWKIGVLPDNCREQGVSLPISFRDDRYCLEAALQPVVDCNDFELVRVPMEGLQAFSSILGK